MGIERIVYHSIRCDECKTVLDEYENNLSKFRCNRVVVSKIANKNGFVKTKSNMWLCPKCANKAYHIV